MSAEKDKQVRVAIVDVDRCKPSKCNQECRRKCPVVHIGKRCIEVTKTDPFVSLSEELCIGCGICAKVCPMSALQIINLPSSLSTETSHRYGPNSFKLHRLPLPEPGTVLGLLGANGTGKTTALKILSGHIIPNLGRIGAQALTLRDLCTHYRGSSLQNFFTKLLSDDFKSVMKPQHVDIIPTKIKGTIESLLVKTLSKQRHIDADINMQKSRYTELITLLELDAIAERDISKLSGGELQRFAIAMTVAQQADVYIFDEPSSFLDIYQRLEAAKIIRSLSTDKNYVIVVEHDLAVLDYMSDTVCCLYGKPNVYGVVTMPYTVREGINVFLSGFVPTENMRFRPYDLTFKIKSDPVDDTNTSTSTAGAGTTSTCTTTNDVKSTKKHDAELNKILYSYPRLSYKINSKNSNDHHTINNDSFSLTIESGSLRESEIIVLLGRNGTGKTTMLRMLAGLADDEKIKQDILSSSISKFVSYKPQMLKAKFDGTVQELLSKRIGSVMHEAYFMSEVIKPLSVNDLYDQSVQTLSGGELQRVAIVIALGKSANVYLLDEPSAYLDSEQRVNAARVIKRYISTTKKTAVIVEHDFIMATYMADKCIVYSGKPGKCCTASSPTSLLIGMNTFLKDLQITFRRDPVNWRPRINKLNSIKDKNQKSAGTYFYMDDDNSK